MSVGDGTGLDRREFLRRAAQTGVATAWAAPVLTTIAAPLAYAQTYGKDFSYVALCYSCDGGATRCCLKVDLNDDGTPQHCEVNNFETPKCTFPYDDNDQNCANCNDVVVSSPDGGSTVIVTLTPSGCMFIEGQGVGKCGNPPETGECVEAIPTPSGRMAIFEMCGI